MHDMHELLMRRTRRLGPRRLSAVLLAAAPLLLAGCGLLGTGAPINPFLTFTEEVAGVSAGGGTRNPSDGGNQGDRAQVVFRQPMTVTFTNAVANLGVQFWFVAFVLPGSLTNADQQDELFANGYTQLTRSVAVGNVVTLPPGTFVYAGNFEYGPAAESARGGGGLAQATRVRLNEGGAATRTSAVFNIITPDGVMIFEQPPVSCDSVAFVYLEDGEPLTDNFFGFPGPYEGATGNGGQKTIAQVQDFECVPFRPGYFLAPPIGGPGANEFSEGQTITVSFNAIATPPTRAGVFATKVFGN